MYTQTDIETIRDIIIRDIPGAIRVILFGSYARGNAREDRDSTVGFVMERIR
jgi:predicted nucleotidyltransferase